jgi:hypothetical protein
MSDLIKQKLEDIDLEKVSKRVSDGLARVAEVKKVISTLKDEGKLIDIIDNDDKTGYETTKAFLSRLQKTRTPLEDERKLTVKPFNDLVDAVNGEYKAAIAEIEEEEKPRKEKRKLYEENQDRIKAEKQAAAEKIIDDKVQRCLEAGLVLNVQNMYYENDKGICCTRLDIQNMPSDNFELLIEKATARKVEKEIEEIEEKERVEKVNKRTEKLVVLGAGTAGSYFVIFNLVTGANEELLKKEIEECTDEIFEEKYQWFKGIKNGNAEYQRKQSEDKLEQERAAKKLKDDRLDLQKNQVSVWQNLFKELGQGYSYAYGAEMEDSEFIFSNPQGKVVTKVGTIFKDNTLVQTFISQSQELIAKHKVETNKAAQKVIDDEKEQSNNKWIDRMEVLKKIGAEYIDDNILNFKNINYTFSELDFYNETDAQFELRVSEIKNKINDYDLGIALESLDGKLVLFKMNEFNVMEEKVNTFISIINNNIENFKEQIKHLR